MYCRTHKHHHYCNVKIQQRVMTTNFCSSVLLQFATTSSMHEATETRQYEPQSRIVLRMSILEMLRALEIVALATYVVRYGANKCEQTDKVSCNRGYLSPIIKVSSVYGSAKGLKKALWQLIVMCGEPCLTFRLWLKGFLV